MKIKQNARHWAAKKALTAPGLGSLVHSGLVRLHTNIFMGKADEDHREERREHLNAFFDGSIDAYAAALDEGYSEAEAREITHIQGSFDFYNHGWTEMMEIPIDEIDDHYRRYEPFFQQHDITIEDPLGEFSEGIPDAPATMDRLNDTELDQPNAVGGYADDVYVESGEGEITQGGTDEPDDVDVSDAVGVEETTNNK